MANEKQQNDLTITRRNDGAIVIEGELNHLNAEAFQGAVELLRVETGSVIVLDMFAFDVDDGVAIATTINALRDLLKRVKKLKLLGASQILCHNLYRVGMLESNDAIELLEMREDEPYG